MHNNSFEFNYSSQEDSSISGQPNAYLPNDYEVQINQTADSFKLNNNQQIEGVDQQLGQLFSKFYHTKLSRTFQKKPNKFEQSELLDRYGRKLVYPPIPNLYFLPTTILVYVNKNEKIIDLRDQILHEYKNLVSVKIHKDKSQELFVLYHDKNGMSFYVIKFVKSRLDHKMLELNDPELSLNPLFSFYQKNYEKNLKFTETCGIFLYWAYQRELLSDDILSESAIKLLVIFFYFSLGEGIPNIISQYKKLEQQELERITKMVTVNRKLQCNLLPEIKNYVNYSLVQKRSFYIESQRKYSTMLQILPIPFPISEKDVERYSQMIEIDRAKLNRIRGEKVIVSLNQFFTIMRYLENCIKRSERVKFDFLKKKGVQILPELKFNIQIKHPIFGFNICEKLTNDSSKLRLLEGEITNVVNISKKCENNQTEAITKIFEKKH